MTAFYKVCPACRGAKQIQGLGMMKLEDCTTCKGKGKIECDTNLCPLKTEPEVKKEEPLTFIKEEPIKYPPGKHPNTLKNLAQRKILKGIKKDESKEYIST